MAKILLQGVECEFRDIEFGETILYENLPKEEQYFRREDPPFTDDEILAIANKELSPTTSQAEWVKKQNQIFDNGIYAYINGILKFIPGSYWDYLNFWTLENGIKPEYREVDRLYYIFCDYCEKHPEIYGVIRGKGRRQGATSMSVHRMVFVARRNAFSNCGIISKTGEDSKTIFTKMVMFGFKALLPVFQPDFDSEDDAKTVLRFVKPMDKRKKGLGAIKREGLNSYIEHKSTALNSFDMYRLTVILIDESGKFPEEVNINDYWEKIYSTLKEGKYKRGFAYLPTTVNPLKNGGEEFELLWKNSNQYKYGINTPTKLVRYFVPAYDGYAGFIDKYGESMVDEAKAHILLERSLKTGNQLLVHRQEYPLDENDMFAFAYGACEFNEENLRQQIKNLEDEPVYIRQMRLVFKTKVVKSLFPGKADATHKIVGAMDDAKGGWFILEMPNEENKISDKMDFFEPLNAHLYSIGVDTTQDRIAINGSNPCILVFKKSHIIDGVETGNYPVAMWISPTRLDIHFDEEVLKACMWYGCKANYELDRRTDFYRFFCKENSQSFLQWTPKIAMNPLKKHKEPEYGTRSGDPFQLAQQLQVAKMYVDGTDNEKYNGNCHRIKFPLLLNELLRYNHLDRQESDQVIALMMALLPVFGENTLPVINKDVRKLLPQYKIKVPA